MKVAVLHGKEDIRIEEREIPCVSTGEALIKVCVCGICGSDVDRYFTCPSVLEKPLILGHEFSGIVKTNTCDFKQGESVIIEPLITCNECELCKEGKENHCKKRPVYGVNLDGAFAEYVKLPINNLHKMPNGFDFKKAAFVEPLALALHAFKKANVVNKKVLVAGSDLVSILIAVLSLKSGCENVKILGGGGTLARVAGCYGIEVVEQIDKGQLYDIVFDTIGNKSIVTNLHNILAPTGELVLNGLFKEKIEIDLFAWLLKEVRLAVARYFTHEDFREGIKILSSDWINIADLTEYCVILDEIKTGFELAKDNSGSRILVLI